jgi:hypothetical protein
MTPTAFPTLRLAYCQNIHPGETWAEHYAALAGKTLEVRKALAAEGLIPQTAAFGLGLRLSAHAANELKAENALQQGNDLFQTAALYPFSINGFPYGKFHKGPVKENVYAPDWRTQERLQYTNALADALATWLPEGESGSISTVPGSYAPWIQTQEHELEMARHLGRAVAHLAALERTTGRHIHLGLEPEPDCYLETTPQTLHFFDSTLPQGALPEIRAALQIPESKALELLRRHLGVCFDTCHVALQFEDPAASLQAYRKAGVRISKVQISAALRTQPGSEAHTALSAFQEPTYLHQVKARRSDGSLQSWPDLPLALNALSQEQTLEELRVHFHVPLFVSPRAPLASTADTLDEGFWSEIRSGACSHLEIETYTFDVLPPAVHPGDLVRSIVEEYRWVLGKLNAGEN